MVGVNVVEGDLLARLDVTPGEEKYSVLDHSKECIRGA
jgi:hypothetical protein